MKKAKVSDKALQKKLYSRAAEMLRQAAEYAEKQDMTWTQVYSEAGMTLMRAANSL